LPCSAAMGSAVVPSQHLDRSVTPESGAILKLLLTSAGVKNASIHQALVGLLGKPIAESSALCIPTAQYGHPMVGPGVMAWQFISGNSGLPMVDLGWKSVGVLELAALPSIDDERWVPLVRETDVLLVAGGDALYLCHWMRESGLADLLPSLTETVWVGLSAGSMVMTPRIGEDFVQWRPPTGDDSTLGIVDFSICPHLAQDGQPGNSMAEAEQWAAGISGPAYAMDDETAIKVVDGTVEVVSEGHWKLFASGADASS
jgi:dipeptidase E